MIQIDDEVYQKLLSDQLAKQEGEEIIAKLEKLLEDERNLKNEVIDRFTNLLKQCYHLIYEYGWKFDKKDKNKVLNLLVDISSAIDV